MYVQAFNAIREPSEVRRLLRHAGAGQLVSFVDGGFDASLMPFVVDDESTALRGHLARANPQWRTLHEHRVLMIVTVSDAYVSPSWYPSKVGEPRTVPTWNYEAVHVHGRVVVHDDAAWVERLVRQLTAARESTRIERGDSSPRWSVDDAPRDFINKQLRAIVGIEVVVERVEAKAKLSQNRSDADQAGVAAALSRSSHTGDLAVASAMRARSDGGNAEQSVGSDTS